MRSTVDVEIWCGVLDGTTLHVDVRNAEHGTAVIKENENYFGMHIFPRDGKLYCDGRKPFPIPAENIILSD